MQIRTAVASRCNRNVNKQTAPCEQATVENEELPFNRKNPLTELREVQLLQNSSYIKQLKPTDTHLISGNCRICEQEVPEQPVMNGSMFLQTGVLRLRCPPSNIQVHYSGTFNLTSTHCPSLRAQ